MFSLSVNASEFITRGRMRRSKMATRKNKKAVKTHINTALSNLEKYLTNLTDSKSSDDTSKADKLAYWIDDYTRFLSRETTFNPEKQMSYRRGDIVKVHLGYRIGNEEGGLHFAIVMDRHNSKKSGVVTVVPLTSKKKGKKINANNVDLGNELFRLMMSKHDKLRKEITAEIHDITNKLKDTEDADQSEIDSINTRLDELQSKAYELSDIRKSILKMKEGSIALPNQIVTVSKLRIYDPRHSGDVLYGIRLSDTILSRIDEKIKDMFL